MRIKLNRNLLRVIILILIIIVAFIILSRVLRLWENKEYKIDAPPGESERHTDLYEGEDADLTFVDGKWYARRENTETVLLIGLDKYENQLPSDDSYANNQQADFIMLLQIDHAEKTFSLLHINRDTMTDIPVLGVGGKNAGSTNAQLAIAHTYGTGKDDSCKNTLEAVSGFLYGVEIDHYVSLTMDAVASVNDAVGGVPVQVMDDFSGIDNTLQKDTEVTLSGSQALTYVRARGSLEDSTNLHRMERQRQYLKALLHQVSTKADANGDFLLATVLDISPYLVSDCTANQLSKIAENLTDYTDLGIRTVPGEAVKGSEFMEFYADEKLLRELVLEMFYTESEIDG